MRMPDLVVLGAGTGGTLVANLLAARQRAELRDGRSSLTLVGETGEHVFQPANLDVAFKGAPPERFVRQERPLLREGVSFLDDAAARIDTAAREVHLASGRTLHYDALVLATGAHARSDLVGGLAETALDFHTGPYRAARIWDALARFAGGRIVVAIAGVPYKCPPSPVEACFLLDDQLRARGLRERSEIRLVTPYARAYPAPAIADVVEPRLAARGVEVSTFFNVDAVDPERRVLTSLEGEEVAFDLLLAVPPHRGAPVIAASGLGDADGWIPTDRETMRVRGQTGVYALGDATDIPISKSGVVAHLQAEVVAANLLADLAHAPDELAYDGRINCPLETGGRQALFVSATYQRAPRPQRPNAVRYAMKKSFGRVYWRVLRGDLEPAFRVYFGPTHVRRRRALSSAPATGATPPPATP